MEVAKENADVIIMDDNFATIVNVAKWGRAVYINIQKFVQFQLTVNVVALMINFVSACISDADSVLNTVIFNSFVFCQVFNEINSRDIEKINVFRGMFDSWIFVIIMVTTLAFQVILVEFLGSFASTVPLSWQLWLLSILIGSISMPMAIVLKYIPVERPAEHTVTVKQHDGYDAIPSVLEFDVKRLLKLSGSDADSLLNTVIFNSFVVCQVFNEINSRDIEKINVFRGMFDSWMFVIIMVTTLAFQVILVEFFGQFC
ncbi:hypothetical protein HHK36_032970 [Tetracentron sinense]|uniref:Cation-transporting P-type ATPase C-terminal domain-containing protein n=1 Tax=Tetracentron sinense TaxID=13715 RepID=A0A835CX49_TETSI|nr:hypothetical protein HHK36_032970 [Tetracentron sinense]